jgi:NAD(P)-dependent dehydrogenase (short-subunit alcohol dehydrogenase family)
VSARRGPPPAGAPVAVVTGAGRGIGRAVADRFSAAGYTIVLAEAQAPRGRRAQEDLRKAGGRATFVPTDVTDVRSVERLVGLVVDRFGRIDCLVNNAGVLAVGPLVRMPVAAIERVLATNLRGPVLLSRAVLPTMLTQRSGAIVNVASQLGKSGLGDHAAYCASKFGLVGFTEALAQELASTAVRVWAVCPGLVDTPMARLAGVRPHERRGLIRPDSVARAVLDLVRGRHRHASGAAIDVLR